MEGLSTCFCGNLYWQTIIDTCAELTGAVWGFHRRGNSLAWVGSPTSSARICVRPSGRKKPRGNVVLDQMLEPPVLRAVIRRALLEHSNSRVYLAAGPYDKIVADFYQEHDDYAPVGSRWETDAFESSRW
jgi:hypothetical protein